MNSRLSFKVFYAFLFAAICVDGQGILYAQASGMKASSRADAFGTAATVSVAKQYMSGASSEASSWTAGSKSFGRMEKSAWTGTSQGFATSGSSTWTAGGKSFSLETQPDGVWHARTGSIAAASITNSASAASSLSGSNNLILGTQVSAPVSASSGVVSRASSSQRNSLQGMSFGSAHAGVGGAKDPFGGGVKDPFGGARSRRQFGTRGHAAKSSKSGENTGRGTNGTGLGFSTEGAPSGLSGQSGAGSGLGGNLNTGDSLKTSGTLR